jgi:hypothetical protein
VRNVYFALLGVMLSEGVGVFSEFDKAEIEQLYRKKYGGLLKFTEADEIAVVELEKKKFGHYNGSGSVMETPKRAKSVGEISTQLSALTDSSSSLSDFSKTSSGFAKILRENKDLKLRFADTRITDVEEEIFAMHKDFEVAADYHAPFLLFMK